MLESYATIVYGNGILACSVAALGRALSTLDPTRARTAIVWDINSETRHVLSHDNLWSLYEVQEHHSHSEREKRSTGQRKNILWTLHQFVRILYIDADFVFWTQTAGHMASAAQANMRRVSKLQSLWSHAARSSAALLAFPHPRNQSTLLGELENRANRSNSTAFDCLNGGFIFLRPNRRDFEALEALGRSSALLEKQTGCKGKDQPLLNSVFARRWSPLLPDVFFGYSRQTDQAWGLARRTRQATRTSTAPVAVAVRAIDAHHIFHMEAAPWSHPLCSSCMRANRHCPRTMPPHKQLRNRTRGAAARALSQAVLDVVDRVWWHGIRQMPEAAQGICHARAKQSASSADELSGACGPAFDPLDESAFSKQYDIRLQLAGDRHHRIVEFVIV
mmetsp:Transcript_49339/g.159913  ORF Transcript_49339/g.159913 Transcript_49339/m.159913 type:complete len:391 (-) Transcript_49339:200-1372(-)